MGEYVGTPPLDVLTKARFYQDALLHAPQLELTVMAVALRDLDLGRLHRCAPAPAYVCRGRYGGPAAHACAQQKGETRRAGSAQSRSWARWREASRF